MSSEDMLRMRLVESNLYFKNVFDLVPAQIYFDPESSQKLTQHARELTAGNNKTRTENSQSNSSVISKVSLKRAKFDPSTAKRTSELQTILSSLPVRDDAGSGDHNIEHFDRDEQKNVKNNTATRVSTVSDSVKVSVSTNGKRSNAELQEGLVAAGSIKVLKKKTDETAQNKQKTELVNGALSSGPIGKDRILPSLQPLFPANLKPTAEQLREKLKARIAELQAKRRKNMTPEDYLEKQKLRRKESKLKLKMKRAEAKKVKLSAEKQNKNVTAKMNGVSEVNGDAENSNNSNKLVFSKFEFSDVAKRKKNDKGKQPKSYKELYEKVTKEKQEMEHLKQTDSEKANKILEKNAWKKAMDMSRGVKVKDNPELIKKSMKKEDKRKQVSQKKWKERQEMVEEQKQKRQEKRKKNILSRKQGRVTKKIDKAKRKGRIISGF